MVKPIKWLFGILAFIIIALTLIIVLVANSIDPNNYRDEISQIAKQQANIDLTIGDIKWSFFPWLGLEVSQSLIATEDKGDLVNVERMKVNVKVMPLLSGNIKVGKIELIGCKINMVQYADGSTNWDSLTQSSTAPETTQTTEETTTPTVNLNIEEILLSDAVLNYQNESDGSVLIIDKANFKASDVNISQIHSSTQFPIQLTFSVSDNQGTSLLQELSALVTLNLKDQVFSIDDIAASSKSNIPGIQKELNALFKGDISLSMNDQTLSARNINIALNDVITLSGVINAQGLDTDPQFKGQFKVAEAKITPLANLFDVELPETSSPEAFQRMASTFTVSGSLDRLEINPLVVEFDNSTASGYFAVDNIATQAIRSKITIDQLNVDHYLPPTTEQPSTSSDDNTASTEPLLPIETMRALNMDMDIIISSLISSGIEIKNARVAVKSQEGKTFIDPIEGELLEGRFKMASEIDVSGPEPKLSLHKDLNQIQIEPAIEAFSDNSALSGLIFFAGDIQTSGNSIAAWKSNLTGDSQLKLTDGLLKGINLTELAYKQLGQLGPLVKSYLEADNPVKLPPAFQKNSNIQQVLADVQFLDGVASTKTLNLTLDDAAATGGASYDMVNEKLKFNLNLRMNESISNAHVANIDWPISCEGNLSAAPSCKINLSPVKNQLETVAKQAAKAKANQAIANKLREKTGLDIAPNQIERSLKDEVSSTKAAKKEVLKSEVKERKEEVTNKLDDKLKERFKGLF